MFVSLAAIGIFTAKGFAAYGGAVTLSRIGNRIIAENQRRMFDKLLHENIGFFADRHSSEFIARLTTGTVAVSQVINLLITAIGRDLMSLIGLCIVMVVQDPAMSIGGSLSRRRYSCSCASSFAECAASPACNSPLDAIHRDHARGAARHAHGQGLRARRRDAAPARRQRRFGRDRIEQDGARRQPRQLR